MPVLPADAAIGYYWLFISITLLLSALFSGLALGLMTLTVRELEEIIATSKNPKEVGYAEKILPVRKYDIKLLCALILATTIVDVFSTIVIEEAFALDGDLSNLDLFQATLITTFALFLLSGLIPMALCTAQALPIGAFFAPAMYPLIYAFYPVSIPVDFFLSPFLKEPEEQTLLPSPGGAPGSTFTAKSVKIINSMRPKANTGLSVKSVKGPSTKLAKSRRLSQAPAYFVDSRLSETMKPWPWADCVSVVRGAVLDEGTLTTIRRSGQRCIPVTSDTDASVVVAMLMTSDLIGVQAQSRTPLVELLDANAA